MPPRNQIYVPSVREFRRPRPLDEILQETYTMARQDRTILRNSGLRTVPPNPRYSPALRAANERRRAQAEARRLASNQPVARTPSGRISRAKYTPEERKARRAAALERRRNPIADLISFDIEESRLRPTLAPEERASRRENALRVRTISKLRSSVRDRRMKSEPAKLIKRVNNKTFRSISDASFSADRVSQILNTLGREVARALGVKKPNHAIRVNLNVAAKFEKSEGDDAAFFYNSNRIIHSLSDLDAFLIEQGPRISDPILYKGANEGSSTLR